MQIKKKKTLSECCKVIQEMKFVCTIFKLISYNDLNRKEIETNKYGSSMTLSSFNQETRLFLKCP